MRRASPLRCPVLAGRLRRRQSGHAGRRAGPARRRVEAVRRDDWRQAVHDVPLRRRVCGQAGVLSGHEPQRRACQPRVPDGRRRCPANRPTIRITSRCGSPTTMVNGTNFWNPEKTGRRIAQRQASLAGKTLVALLDWKDKDGKVVLEETKRVSFGGGADAFWMDHDITLKAPNVAVSMGDTKEGAFGIRLNDTLKESGRLRAVHQRRGSRDRGRCLGQDEPWVAIRGVVTDASRGNGCDRRNLRAPEPALNSPPYWHARDYGLFCRQPVRPQRLRSEAQTRITTLGMGERARAVPAGRVPGESHQRATGSGVRSVQQVRSTWPTRVSLRFSRESAQPSFSISRP